MPTITQLPVASIVNVGDLFVIVQGGVTKQATDSLVLASVQTQIQITESQVTNLTTDLAARLIAANNLSDVTNPATSRSNLGLGTIATFNAGDYVATSGSTMTGALILNTSSPSVPLQAASKGYVDSVATGLTVQGACVAASTVTLTVTYDNGVAGVGATLTNAGVQAAFAIDGYTASLNDRILIKNQSSTFQNGIYTVTTLGSGASNWVLTRATDYDTAAEIQPGDFVLITAGTVNATTSWIETATVVTMGTDPIVFAAFSASPSTFLVKTNNLSDVSNAATSRTNLGLGSVATKTASNAALTNAVMQNAASIVGNLPKYDDVNGSLIDSGFPISGFIKTVKTQVFTSSGTYTPSTGMLFCYISITGGGASGGGAAGGVNLLNTGGGGGSGEYAAGVFTAATIGASTAVTIGAGGTVTGAAAGNNGGVSSVTSASLSAAGGGGGGTGTGSGTSSRALGGPGGSGGTGGTVRMVGQNGSAGVTIALAGGVSGCGGGNPLGLGGANVSGITGGGAIIGLAGTGYGAGSGGALAIGNFNASNVAGQAGAVVIIEYCSQ